MAQIHQKRAGGCWSDPDTWEGGRVPGPDDFVTVRAVTVRSPDGTVSVEPDDSWVVEPDDDPM